MNRNNLKSQLFFAYCKEYAKINKNAPLSKVWDEFCSAFYNNIKKIISWNRLR